MPPSRSVRLIRAHGLELDPVERHRFRCSAVDVVVVLGNPPSRPAPWTDAPCSPAPARAWPCPRSARRRLQSPAAAALRAVPATCRCCCRCFGFCRCCSYFLLPLPFLLALLRPAALLLLRLPIVAASAPMCVDHGHTTVARPLNMRHGCTNGRPS